MYMRRTTLLLCLDLKSMSGIAERSFICTPGICLGYHKEAEARNNSEKYPQQGFCKAVVRRKLCPEIAN